MLAHDRPRLQPFRACGEDVVLAERLEHGRPHDQRVLAVEHEPERERGQEHVVGEVAHVLPPGRREQEVVHHPAGREDAREQDHEHQREPVRRHRVEAERRRHRHVLERRAPPPGGEHARERAEDDCEHRADEHHRDRVRQVDLQVVRHRLGVLVRDPEVPVGELLQVDDVLLAPRLVEAELLRERASRLRGRVRHA